MTIFSEFFESDLGLLILIPFLVTFILPCNIHSKKFNWGIILSCLAVYLLCEFLIDRVHGYSAELILMFVAVIALGAFLGRLLRLGLTAAVIKAKQNRS